MVITPARRLTPRPITSAASVRLGNGFARSGVCFCGRGRLWLRAAGAVRLMLLLGWQVAVAFDGTGVAVRKAFGQFTRLAAYSARNFAS